MAKATTRRGGGVADIRRRMDVIRRNVRDALEAEVKVQADATLALSRNLAPQLTGYMIASSTVTNETRASADLIAARITYPAPYALYQHEGTYNPGPVTAAKLGPTRGIGRKFLQKALDQRREEIIVRCGRAVERALRISLR